MAARRMPPALEQFAQRILHEAKLSLARASSVAVQSIAQDVRRVPEIVQQEAAKAQAAIDGFVGSIANEEPAAERDAPEKKPRAQRRRAPKTAAKKSKRASRKPRKS